MIQGLVFVVKPAILSHICERLVLGDELSPKSPAQLLARYMQLFLLNLGNVSAGLCQFRVQDISNWKC